MLLRKSTLTQAARRHFGLARDPFNDEINSADDLYITPDVRYVREAMFQTACHGGFMAAVGESGAGKSTLREDLQDRIMREGRQIVMIEPYVTGDGRQRPKGQDTQSGTYRRSHFGGGCAWNQPETQSGSTFPPNPPRFCRKARKQATNTCS